MLRYVPDGSYRSPNRRPAIGRPSANVVAKIGNVATATQIAVRQKRSREPARSWREASRDATGRYST